MSGIMSGIMITNITTLLPDEILLFIISKLDRHTLIELCHTNKLLSRLVLEHLFRRRRKNILIIDRILHRENIYILDYAYKNYNSGVMFNFLWYTTKQLSVIKWLCSVGISGKSHRTMYNTLRNGTFDISTWLFENIPESHIAYMIDEIVYQGNLNIIKWLHHHELDTDKPLASINAMNYAAHYGHIDILEWLHTHRHEGCTTDAMDLAAKSGYIHILDWLHNHRYEGCTENALIMAVYQENVDVIKWLIRNKSEQFPISVIFKVIIQGGHLKLLKYFSMIYPEYVTEECIYEATQYNNINIVKWYFQENFMFDLATCIDVAVRYGNQRIAHWLYSNSTIQAVNNAISKANQQRNVLISLYIWFSKKNGL